MTALHTTVHLGVCGAVFSPLLIPFKTLIRVH